VRGLQHLIRRSQTAAGAVRSGFISLRGGRACGHARHAQCLPGDDGITGYSVQ
jgi:hypothetical protein